jgi:hypothetical protein
MALTMDAPELDRSLFQRYPKLYAKIRSTARQSGLVLHSAAARTLWICIESYSTSWAERVLPRPRRCLPLKTKRYNRRLWKRAAAGLRVVSRHRTTYRRRKYAFAGYRIIS